ncbi:Sucrose phosphorylase [compost metagenome]
MIASLEKEGALVSYKNNADGSVSPYEINVTYMDALNKKNDDDSLRLQRFMLAHSILLAFPGVPAVYIQSILGSRNDYAGVETAGYNRAINRHKFMLDEIMTELEQEDALRAKVYTQLGELIKLRRTRPEFHPDSRMDVEFIGEGVFCFSRVTENNEKIICLFNVTNEEQLVKAFNGQCYTDLITQNEVADNIRLQPYQYMWLY